MTKAEFWDGVADSYAARPIQNLDLHDRTVERSASYLTPEAQVLEIGCGTGTIALRLAPHAGHVLATDISARLLEIAEGRRAEKGVSNVSFARHEAADLPEGPFDAVMSFNVLHLIEDMDGALAAIAAGAILWFARNPVLKALFGEDWVEDDETDEEYDDEWLHSEQFGR